LLDPNTSSVRFKLLRISSSSPSRSASAYKSHLRLARYDKGKSKIHLSHSEDYIYDVSPCLFRGCLRRILLQTLSHNIGTSLSFFTLINGCHEQFKSLLEIRSVGKAAATTSRSMGLWSSFSDVVHYCFHSIRFRDVASLCCEIMRARIWSVRFFHNSFKLRRFSNEMLKGEKERKE
jgi:hypothetical protein